VAGKICETEGELMGENNWEILVGDRDVCGSDRVSATL